MKRIWIVGSLGHMGQALINLLDMKSYELYETDKDEVDITDEEQVFTFMNRNRPDVIINCAGYNAYSADGIPDSDRAYSINAVGRAQSCTGGRGYSGEAHSDIYR